MKVTQLAVRSVEYLNFLGVRLTESHLIARSPHLQNLPQIPALKSADFAARAVVDRQWIVEPLIPKGEPTLVYGPGAAGKSLLLLQLALAMAAGRDWLGKPVPAGRVLFYTCEDDTDELNRRASLILKALGATWEDCGDRFLCIPMRECDTSAVLASADRDGTLKTTPTYEALKRRVISWGPQIVIIDTLADAFAGNENDRAHAKQFIKLVQSLGLRREPPTFIVTAHPSVSGMTDGRGASGSTGWPNAVRSHLYLERAPSDTRDPDLRILSSLKANYARGGSGAIEMRWRAGVFVAVDVEARERDTADLAESVFMDLLRRFTDQGRYVNAASGATYAPSIFAKEERAKAAGVTRGQLTEAMGRLFDGGLIVIATRRVAGHERRFIEAVDQD